MTDDDIKAPADEPLCSSCGYPLKEYTAGLRHFGTHTAHVEWYCVQRLKAEVERLRAERDALKPDAERYRWMTEHRLGWFSRLSPLPWGKQTKKDALDAAIDAAREAGR